MGQYKIRWKARMDVGERSGQQDAFRVSSNELRRERGVLAVLSDGMGGMQGGERFSAIATSAMQRHFAQMPPSENSCDDLLEAYGAAREEALRIAEEEELDGGATVVAVLLRDDTCAFLSVGDSRIYLLRGGELIQLNREQTLGVLLDEGAALGFVTEDEAKYNLRRASLMNHLCERETRQCDRNIAPFRLCPGDKIALMSDGVFGALSEEEIAKKMRRPGVSGVDEIIDAVRAKAKPRQDNMSILMLYIFADDSQGNARGNSGNPSVKPNNQTRRKRS